MWGKVGFGADESLAFQPEQTVASTRTDAIFR